MASDVQSYFTGRSDGAANDSVCPGWHWFFRRDYGNCPDREASQHRRDGLGDGYGIGTEQLARSGGKVTLREALRRDLLGREGDATKTEQRRADVNSTAEANAGQKWVFERSKRRDKSPLDSRLEVLDAEGKPVPSCCRRLGIHYITFRGINSDTRDCRVHNWEEMDLNQYLYMNGRVRSCGGCVRAVGLGLSSSIRSEATA